MRALFPFMLVLVANVGSAQSAESFKVSPSFLAISVSDMEVSIRWYQKLLDVKELKRMEFEGIKVAILENKENGVLLEVMQFPKSVSEGEVLKGRPEGTSLRGFFKAGFTVDKFDAFVKKLEREKISFVVRPMRDGTTGQQNFIIADPDGNRLQFFER